jgi:alkanesulfonate monooxygenase SsuD/methylene tetrahydromethanopterin reductase-like flavin-dependent oxidoreductase (luciferase family)
MLRLAGEHADGVHVHPLNTPTYLRETVVPSLAEGASRSGRSLDEFEVIVPSFVVVGDTDDERARWRERARMQVAFYGSTPNYAFVFEQVGREGTTEALRERQKAGDIPGMATVIGDDLLRHFIVEGSWSTIADAIHERYAGTATRVVNYFGAIGAADDPTWLDRWKPVSAALAAG